MSASRDGAYWSCSTAYAMVPTPRRFAASSAAIVRATIDLGHGLGLLVVAEGVEDAAILEALRALRCDLAQGFLFAKPMPAAQIEEWLVAAR